jgi:hypothetical protein
VKIVRAMDYQSFAWGLDPSYSSFWKVFCRDIKHSIVRWKSGNIFSFTMFHRPVSKVEVVGVITNVVRSAKRFTAYVDDGTEVVRCVKFLNVDEQPGESDVHATLPSMTVGCLACIRGFLAASETNNDLYDNIICIKNADVLSDPNAEILHWTSAMMLRNVAYDKKVDLPAVGLIPSLISCNQTGSAVSMTSSSSLNQANRESEGIVATSAHIPPRVGVDPFMLCTCDARRQQSSSLTAVPSATAKVREKYLYCRCTAAKLRKSSLDPNGDFSVILLGFLSRSESAEPDGQLLVLSFEDIRNDRSIQSRAKTFLDSSKASREELLQDIFDGPLVGSRHSTTTAATSAGGKRSASGSQSLSQQSSLKRVKLTQEVTN